MIKISDLLKKIFTGEQKPQPCCAHPGFSYQGTDISQGGYTDNYKCLNCGTWKSDESLGCPIP